MSRRGKINEFGEFVRNVPSRVTNSSSSDESSGNPILTFFGGLMGFAFCIQGFLKLIGVDEPSDTVSGIIAIASIIFGFYSVGKPGSASTSWVIAMILIILAVIIH